MGLQESEGTLEVLGILSGVMRLIIEQLGIEPGSSKQTGRIKALRLEPGHFALVPRACWHTADVEVAGKALYITYGADTQHRPR